MAESKVGWQDKVSRAVNSGRKVILAHFNIDDELVSDKDIVPVRKLAIEATGREREVVFSIAGWSFDSYESELIFRKIVGAYTPPENPGAWEGILDDNNPESYAQYELHSKKAKAYTEWTLALEEGEKFGLTEQEVLNRVSPVPSAPLNPMAVNVLRNFMEFKSRVGADGEISPLGETSSDDFVLVLDYAHTIVPRSEVSNRSEEQRVLEVLISEWSSAKDSPCVLLFARNLGDINSDLYGRGCDITTVQIPYPDEGERYSFLNRLQKEIRFKTDGVNTETLARLSAGLSNRHLKALAHECVQEDKKITLGLMQEYKQAVINDELNGLVEFITPVHGWETIGGLEHVKDELGEIAEAVLAGQNHLVPMGMLLTGPPGTGKTCTAEAFAKSVGFNVIRMKNVKSKWLGETESNAERLLEVAKALAPVVIFVDEIDQQSGQRSSYDGDGGASAFIFSLQLKTMSDTELRGKILWIGATNRPDMMDPAMKRPGRFDVRIPLLYPSTLERMLIFQAIFRKYSLDASKDVHWETLARETEEYNGADIEVISLSAAKFAYRSGNGKTIGMANLMDAITDYIPQQDKEEVKKMTAMAIKESSSIRLVPEPYKSKMLEARAKKSVAAVQV